MRGRTAEQACAGGGVGGRQQDISLPKVCCGVSKLLMDMSATTSGIAHKGRSGGTRPGNNCTNKFNLMVSHKPCGMAWQALGPQA